MILAVSRLQPLRIGLLLLAIALGIAGCAVSLEEGKPEGEEATEEEGAAAQDVPTEVNHHDLPNYPCGPADVRWSPAPSTHYLGWTPNGKHIIFSFVEGSRPSFTRTAHSLGIIDVRGSRLRLVVDANPVESYYGMPYGFYADISPDGSRVVYTSCEFPKTGRQGVVGEKREPADYNYEIAVINVDGSDQQRLSQNSLLDHFPVWSPDGSRVASVVDFAINRPTHRTTTGDLYTVAADGSDVRRLEPPGLRDVAFAPPLWSPNGEYLAFITRSNESFDLNTIRADGTGERVRIGPVLDTQTRPRKDMPPPVPSWSPDGRFLAFAAAAEESDSSTVSTVYAVRPDGSEKQALLYVQGHVSHVLWSPSGEFIAILAWIWNGDTDDAIYLYVARSDGTELGRHIWDEPLEPWIDLPSISWSPTRAELLVNDDGNFHAFLIQVSDGELHTMSLEFVQYPALAAWSPDGERIAVYSPIAGSNNLWTIARDGADFRLLLLIDYDGNLVPANPPQ